MGDYRGKQGRPTVLLEHAVRVDENGVLFYKVYAEVVYLTKEEFSGFGECTRQGSLFPEVGQGGGRGSDDQLRLKSQKYDSEEPYDDIQDAAPEEEAPPELTEEECAEWLADGDDAFQFNGSPSSEPHWKGTRTGASSNSNSTSNRPETRSQSHSHSPSTTPLTPQGQTPRQPRWPTSSGQRTSSKGSWGSSR
ncbi:MAG: hypothetical protein [Circular genetic element sp.]|nr:MAG: hypothetical protein [Circular genetic element sp.]